MFIKTRSLAFGLTQGKLKLELAKGKLDGQREWWHHHGSAEKSISPPEATWPDWSQKVMVVGDGGVWSNLEDMDKWDSAVRAKKFLKPATWKEALAPSKTRKGKVMEYGKGWFIYANNDGYVYGYGHDGTWAGFENSDCRHLGSNRSIVILSNRDTLDTDNLWTALDALVEKHVGE